MVKKEKLVVSRDLCRKRYKLLVEINIRRKRKLGNLEGSSKEAPIKVTNQ